MHRKRTTDDGRQVVIVRTTLWVRWANKRHILNMNLDNTIKNQVMTLIEFYHWPGLCIKISPRGTNLIAKNKINDKTFIW